MSLKNYSIVVAEDESLLLDNIVKKIHNLNLGFEVVGKAQTGIQAYHLIKELNPDIVITDIKMPLMGGMELIEKAQNLYPFIKFIIISGFSDFEYAKQAIRLQISEYLLKPVDEEELQSALIRIQQDFETELLTYSEIFNPDIASKRPEEIAELLKNYLINNYNIDINLNMIAKKMNYSSSYLTKLFQQQYDTTPNKFIISMRLGKAKHYLSHNPELTISQIGEIVGYQDQAYFSRIFKKHCGCSPTHFRDALY